MVQAIESVSLLSVCLSVGLSDRQGEKHPGEESPKPVERLASVYCLGEEGSDGPRVLAEWQNSWSSGENSCSPAAAASSTQLHPEIVAAS